MTSTLRRPLLALAAGGAALAMGAVPAAAQQTAVKFTLDFVIQGPQAPFFLAAERGHYAKEGVNLTALDAGRGSADTVNRIASGAYDIGIGDINALIEFNSKNPGKELIAVMMYYDSGPFAIITLRDKGIASPKDLAGRKAAAPSFDTPFRLFSLFAKATGIDPKSVTWANVAPPLREPMLAQGQADLISGFSFTISIFLFGPIPILANRAISSFSDGCVGQNRSTKFMILNMSDEDFICSTVRGLMNVIGRTDFGAGLPRNSESVCTL